MTYLIDFAVAKDAKFYATTGTESRPKGQNNWDLVWLKPLP